MKKILAISLALVMAISLCACGTINKTNVHVLWSGSQKEATVPNSLINATDRAMYIEKIAYVHEAASGDQSVQTEQAQKAIDAGCAGLLVELVDSAEAQTIIDLAKAKDVPVVFFNCDVEKSVISSYGKCAIVNTDEETLAAIYGKMIGETIIKNIEEVEKKPKKTVALDRNGDGVISYCPVGDVSALVEETDKILKEAGYKALVAVEGANIDSVLDENNDENGNMIELVITASDEEALEVLKVLQSIGYNKDRLTTHCIPLFTVGADADASAFTDTSTMKEEELETFIYNAMNLTDAGQMAGTAMEDYDGIAVAAAEVLRDLIKGNEVKEVIIKVPYTIYGEE